MKSDLVFSSGPDVHGVCQAEVKQVGFHLLNPTSIFDTTIIFKILVSHLKK